MVRLYETWFRGVGNQRGIRGIVRSGSKVSAIAHLSWWCFVVVVTLMILSEVVAVDAPMLVNRYCCAAADGNAAWLLTSQTAVVSVAKLYKYALIIFLPLIIIFTALVAGLCVLKRQAVTKTSQLEKEIAERKRIVTTLTLRDRAISGTTNGIIITDHTPTDNPIIYVNPAFERITGFSADEVIGLDCRFLQKDDRNQPDLDKIRSAIAEERDCRAMLRNYRRDGSMFWNELSISPVRDEKGKVTHFVGIISDITRRKNVEEAVLEAARFPNENPNPVLRISADGTIIYCNKASSELLNFWRCGQNEPLPEPHREFVREALSSGLTKEVDVQCGCRTYSLFFTPIADVNYVNVYGLDITDRKRAENDLEKERNLLRTLIDNIPDYVYVKDTQNRFVSVNTAVAHVMGAKDEHELIGKTDFEYYPQEAAAEYYSDEQRIIESGRPIINKDEPHLDKDGNMMWLLTTKVPLRDSEGNIIGIVGVSRNITERKKAEEALRQSELNYRAIFDGANDAIFIHDIETGRILDVNRKMYEMYGYTPQEVGELTIEDISSGQSPYTQRDALRWIKKAAEGLPQVFEWRAKDKDDRLFWVEVNLKLAAIGGKDRVLVVVRDISERKQAEEIRDRLNKELEAKNKELESILYVASHDLRSPLVNIEGFSRELSISCQKLRSALKGKPVKTETEKQTCKLLEEDIPEALNFILASSRKMDSLMSGLLRLSRLGREATNIKKLDMNAMMDNIIASMEYQLKESSAAVVLESLPPCLGDASQINQVFSNILDNALKYLDCSRRGRIHITGTVQAEQSIYCIEDNGVGISADQQEKIFEIFYRLGSDDKTGEGLGLSIVRRILDRHNGRVWVESVENQGSRFYVSLPTA